MGAPPDVSGLYFHAGRRRAGELFGDLLHPRSVHITLLPYRAHLEEVRLAEHSSEYRELQKRAGFIFPKFSSSPR
jgi:hypothetical protein